MDLGLSIILARILQFFHEVLGVEWGWAIILLTVLIKILLFPTSISQFRSMEKMKKIQPLYQKLQEKYKNDPQELQKKTMELYKAHNVNPLGGCLPILIQLPFLVGLFTMLNNPDKYGIDMSNAVFLGMNLLQSGYIPLGIVSGVTTFLQQKMTPTAGADSSQSTMMYIMPFFIGWLTITLKAGVGLYWTASTILGIAQQWVINRFILAKESPKEELSGEKDQEQKGKPKKAKPKESTQQESTQ
ncbi:MAG: YidC/Oxa1 family membrane protein insertase [Clostridia bacterium]|nr:YidC/Oxa1 family membrane protein insertase [Clostridia bacterium]